MYNPVSPPADRSIAGLNMSLKRLSIMNRPNNIESGAIAATAVRRHMMAGNVFKNKTCGKSSVSVSVHKPKSPFCPKATIHRPSGTDTAKAGMGCTRRS